MSLPYYMRPLRVRLAGEDGEFECVGSATAFDAITAELTLVLREDLTSGRGSQQLTIAPDSLLAIEVFVGDAEEMRAINGPLFDRLLGTEEVVVADEAPTEPAAAVGEFRRGRFAYTQVNGRQVTVEIVACHDDLIEVVCRSGELRGNSIMIRAGATFAWID